jgi:WD40-like Beta Propeller Repeat
MSLTVERPPTDALDAGVIEEARTRQRRLRRRGATVAAGLAALLVALLTVSPWGSKPASSRSSLTFVAHGPTVDSRAFAQEGDLAFVSRGSLWVLDGSGRLRRLPVPHGLAPASPAFSPDGRWLAYAAATGDGGGIFNSTPEVWIAHANGSDPREIGGLRNPAVIGWSPRGDQLALTAQSAVRAPDGVIFERHTSLWLLTPGGERRKLMSADSIDGAAWSPDASRLAVATDTSSLYGPHPAAALVVYTVATGRAVTWLRLPLARASATERGANLLLPVGWWPRWGIGFWLDNASGNDPSVRDSGGLELLHLDGPGQAPAPLGDTLSDGAVSPIVASSRGELAITNEPGGEGARPLWQNQEVERCSPAAQSCVPVPHPRGDISLDPVWSPDGTKLAYLVGRDFGSAGGAGFTQSVIARWYDSLQLWLYGPTIGRSVRMPVAQGAVVPIWSKSGDSLLFVADDGLWLWKHTQGEPVEVAGPLLSLDDWNAYFAQIDWSDRFAWSR